MKLNKFIKEYKLFKINYRKKNKLNKLFEGLNLKNNTLKPLLIACFGIFVPSVIITDFLDLFINNPFILAGISICLMIKFFYIHLHFSKKNAEKVETDKKSYFYKKIIKEAYPNNLKNQKLAKMYKNNLTKEDNIIFEDIEFIHKKIKLKLIEEYKDKNKKSFLQSKNAYERDAREYAFYKKVNFKDVIFYVFNNIKSEEIKDLNQETLKEILSDLTLKEKNELTIIIKEKLELEENKKDLLSDNLKQIEKLKTEEKNYKIKIGNTINVQ